MAKYRITQCLFDELIASIFVKCQGPPFLPVYAPSFDNGIPFNNDLLYLTGSNICASDSAVVFSHYRYCSLHLWSSKERVSILSCCSWIVCGRILVVWESQEVYEVFR